MAEFPSALLVASVVGVVCVWAGVLSYRQAADADAKETQADEDLERARRDWLSTMDVEHAAAVATHEAKMARLAHDLRFGFDDERIPFGSLGNPVITPVGHKAYWSRIEDFAPVVLP